MRLLLLLAFSRTALAGEFPVPFNTEPTAGAPMSPEEALAAVKVPPGFHVTMFAAEPDVQQPIAIATDARGRLWVAECFTYAEQKVNFDPKLRDRILILEDTDHDGRFDKRTVFWDQAERLTSVQIGLGGVWVTCAPNLLFIPDKNGDDIPDGPPEIVLDGWDHGPVRHNIVNGLNWGPDGWLYGRHGILATSLVGAPGTPAEQRTEVNTGIWRYHPAREKFEVVAHGTTNPWGMDWNDTGEAFFSNTVTGHLWHLIPGAHYERMYGEDANPHVYELMKPSADHFHFDTGADWSESRATFDGVPASASDALGGGHAHCGALIYQGEQWPPAWRGKLLTINFHGRRLNVERLERDGSGYVARHEPDAFFFGDPWFRGIDLIQAADGGIYVADWSDASECHDHDGVHRTSGRIYKITYGDPKVSALPGDVAKLTDADLVQAQLSTNEWLVRQARLALQTRVASATPEAAAQTQAALRAQYQAARDTHGRLRTAWALHAAGATTSDLLASTDEFVRAWAVRFQQDTAGNADLAGHLRNEKSPLVRLAIAARANRDPALCRTLAETINDADDRNLQLAAWYAIEPWLSAPDLRQNIIPFVAAKSSLIRRLGARRIANAVDSQPEALTALLAAAISSPPSARRDFLEGIAEALDGRREVSPPANWASFAASLKGDVASTDLVRGLSILFGDGGALAEVRAIALDSAATPTARSHALQLLIEARAPELRAISEKLLEAGGTIAGTAARGLATFDDPAAAALLVEKLNGIAVAQRPEAIGALVSRPAWAALLLDAIAAGKIARTDLGAFHARQIRSFEEEALTKRLSEVWGDVRETDDGKKALIAKLKTQLTPEALSTADLPAGRALFAMACAACHKLHGEGGAFGPDLTGSARELVYLIENITDPSAVVPVDFRLSTVTLKDGRVLTGFVGGKTERTFTLRDLTGTQTVEHADVREVTGSMQSIMPEGILSGLSETQVRDLMAYLMGTAQVPLPAAAK